MNLSCIAGFVICLTNTMNMAVIMILLNGIPMIDIHLAMIPIKDAPEQLQKPWNSSRTTFANPVTIQNSTRTAELTDRALFTAQSRTLCRVTIPEKQGDNTLFINSDQLLFTQQYPSRIMEITIAFG